MTDQWFGKLKGHVGEAKGRAATDRAQREEAEAAPRSVILTKNDVQGEYDAHRVLTTTLGGALRGITADDLATFRRNMKLAQKNFHGNGITARQVVDLASSRQLKYVHAEDGSDITKARREITMAMPVSAMGGEVRFITNAGPESKVNRHHVLVRFNAFAEAANKLAATKAKDMQSPKQVANWLRKQKLAFDCDCERHRYFLRYVSTIGNFNAGRPEHGYPKIRNPKLKGVACKHVLRVMAEIDSSGTVWSFLTKHMERLQASSDNTARTQQKQKEAEEASGKQTRPRAIKTSEQRAIERAKASEKAGFHQAVKAAPPMQKKPVASRKVEAALAGGGLSAIELATLRKFGFTDAQIANKLKKG